MGVEVVHDQRDALGLGITRSDGLDKQRPVTLGPALGHLRHARARQRLAGHEHVARAQAPILIVLTLGLARGGRDRFTGLPDELARCLVHAHHR